MKLLPQTNGIRIALFATFLLLSGLNLFADGKYVLDWRYTIDNNSANIMKIWLINGDSTIYANVQFDDNYFLNVNSQKVERYLKNPKFDSYENGMSYDGKTVYAFSDSIYKIDAKSAEVIDSFEGGICGCGDRFITRDERLYINGYNGLNSKNNGLITYSTFAKKGSLEKRILFEFGNDHSSKSIEQVYMTKEGKYLIYIQKFTDKNPDKSGYELVIVDTAATKIYFQISGTSKFAVSDDESLLAYCSSSSDNDKRVVIMNLKNLQRLDSIPLPPAPTEKYIRPPHLVIPKNFTFSKDNSLLSIGGEDATMFYNVANQNSINWYIGTISQSIFSADNKYVYCSTPSVEIFRLKRDTATTIETDLQKIELTLNPNPTNFNLKLTYVNPKEAIIKIDLINFTGQEVQQLFSGIETQGRIEHNFNLSSILTGSYAIQISIDGVVYFKNFIKE